MPFPYINKGLKPQALYQKSYEEPIIYIPPSRLDIPPSLYMIDNDMSHNSCCTTFIPSFMYRIPTIMYQLKLYRIRVCCFGQRNIVKICTGLTLNRAFRPFLFNSWCGKPLYITNVLKNRGGLLKVYRLTYYQRKRRL